MKLTFTLCALLLAAQVAGQTSVTTPDASVIVQAQQTQTLADGSWNVTWQRQFDDVPRVVIASVPNAVDPYICQSISATVTTSTGRCWRITPSTLGGTVTSLPGTVISPFVNAAGNITVMVVGRQ